MIQYVGKNIFDFPCDAICVTTNGVVKKDGELVMGGGIALQFKLRHSVLPTQLGLRVKQSGNKCYLITEPNKTIGYDYKYQYVISFPTKNHYKDDSSLELIQESVSQLIEISNVWKLKTIALPFPGIGLGNLKYEEVLPLVERLDDRFHLFRL
jgi:hypothetical protein